MDPSEFNIVACMPFWRYAVSSGRQHQPGIPFYTLKGARKFYEETKEHLPWADVYLLKRPSILWRSVIVVASYHPE